jgi:glycosyltransferase involved in cell wall biosynthesis
MRVLLVGPATPGGEGAYMSLLRSHPPSGIDYSSVGGFHAGGPGVRCDVPWEVALNRLLRPRAIPDMGFRALRLRASFDLVHVHAHPARIARLGRTPVVMSEGSSSAVYLGDYLGWDEDRLDRGFRRSRRLYRALGVRDRLLALERVTRVYVFSEWARRLNVRWGADPAKLEVLPPGFPAPAPPERTEGEIFSFLFVGTDFERKGGFDVVEAFARVVREHPHARLVVAGSDPWQRNPDRAIHSWVGDDRRRRVLAQLEQLERKGLARQEPLVDTAVLQRSLYPSADAFVMPTLAEGFGFTNVEAMSYALPVVSSRVGPIPEVVEHERAGLLVAAGDVDALTDAMGRLVADPPLARRLGEAGREIFLARHTLERFQERLGAFYRDALEQPL